jgi:two-component system, OmpR family, phosphate regulon sensor histidine kinase PhoR
VTRCSDADQRAALQHDLRTPLTSIAGFVELLADGSAGPVTAEQKRLLDAIARNAVKLTVMIDGLPPRLDSGEGAA